MSSTSSPSRGSSIPGLAGWIILCFVAPALGAFSMPDAWYASLHKPSWNPPAWVFGPVWTLLYTMMAVSAWLVWRRGGFALQRGALSLFLAQLALNAAWTPLFFGLHLPGLAFVDIALLWLGIVATIAAFRRVHRGAAWLLVPYLLWVSFASVLNFTLWRMNP
jgi:benzodiazapine receptor